ncbi:MAG: hypothetical protein M1838_000156 [Thelocarpon superellum]|nr:MAG: hypothetical protein M1838_000156 [Thelocarpon superellum]
MSLHTTADVSLLITSASSSSERRITPSWSIATLKSKLEPVTGIPPSSQRLVLHVGGAGGVDDDTLHDGREISAPDETKTTLENWRLSRGDSIYGTCPDVSSQSLVKVHDLRPPSARPNWTDASQVPKYMLPAEKYAALPSTVLAWKKAEKLGRFDPDAPAKHEAMVRAHEEEAKERGLEVGLRCRVGADDTRRGAIAYVGPVPEIPGQIGGWWIGVRFDEPVGRNDGSVKVPSRPVFTKTETGPDTTNNDDDEETEEKGVLSEKTAGTKQYFDAQGPNRGIFVRPERVEAGDFPPLMDLEELEEL